jgi:uncharacterized membrane protein
VQNADQCINTALWHRSPGVVEMTDPQSVCRAVLVLAGVAMGSACRYDQYNPATPLLPTFTIQQLGVLTGGTESEATGGSATLIVGWATDASNQRHAVTFAAGHAMRLPEPSGASASEAHGVNAEGVIVGAAAVGGIRRAVSWSSLTAAPLILPTLGGTFGIARSINDQNVIAGVVQAATGDTVIVLWQPGGANYVVAPFDSGGGVDWRAVGVDNLLDVAGNLGPVSSGGGAFYANPTVGIDTIVPPGAGTTVAHGLNQHGIVVGAIVAGSSPPSAFAFTDAAGTVVLGIPPSGYTGIVANSITDNGIIAGTASTSDAAGNTLTSVAAITSVTNLAATFTPLPSPGASLVSAADNGVTPCGVILGRAALSGSTSPVAVAWVPAGCTLP